MRTPDLFDRRESIRRRDEGMELAVIYEGSFAEQYRAHILSLPLGWRGTNEDIRRDWKGVHPRKPNAWGSCWGAAVRAGLLIWTPEIVKMEAVKSHARKTHVYRKGP